MNEGDILIVDDNPDNLRILRTLLSKQGYSVRVATSGIIALDSARAEPPDLILLDTRMPEMDGFEVCERLKAEERTREVPILFISTLEETEEKVRAFQTGGVDYITKSFQEAEVLVRIKTHLTIHRLQQELQKLNSTLEEQVVVRTEELARTNDALKKEIEERKQAKEALRESKKQYELATSAGQVGIWDWNLETNEIYLDPNLKNMLGYEDHEIRNHLDDWGQHVHPDDAEQVMVEARAYLEGLTPHYEIVHRMVHKDGSIRWFLARGTAIRDKSGKPYRMLGTDTDITERKRMQESLQKAHDELESRVKERTAELVEVNEQLKREIEERKRTEKALAAMALFAEMNPAPVLRTDLYGTILLANRAANELFEDSQLIGNSWYVLCPAVDGKDFDQLSHGKETLQHEYRIGEKDLLFTYLSNVDYGIVHIYGTDITQRKQLEEQLLQSQKMKAVGQLAGGIAHDFNTLLGIILGYGDMMRDDLPEDSFLRDALEEILEAGSQAKALVKHLLDFARPTEEERHPIRLALVVEDSLRLLRSSLPTTITIRQHIKTRSSSVLVNASQIAQVIMNLGMNAADAIGEQEGEIEMTLEDVEVDAAVVGHQVVKRDSYVRLSVSDTGCGMSPDNLKHIFEPFFTTKEFGKGFGLGLSVAHGIIRSHGGFITVESTPGKGSRFQMYLPMIKN